MEHYWFSIWKLIKIQSRFINVVNPMPSQIAAARKGGSFDEFLFPQGRRLCTNLIGRKLLSGI